VRDKGKEGGPRASPKTGAMNHACMNHACMNALFEN
jgi:hypothetical protein